MDWALDTPLILIIFNRPDTTARVFEQVAKVRPRRLFVVADGPRAHRPEDVALCAAARAVTESIDWECDVTRNYSPINLGCGIRPATGISWAFEQVEEAIVLEDDCVPDPTFFRFCQELLAAYRHDQRIMSITGDNFQSGRNRTRDSYYFSRYPSCWGWATWRRAWKSFDHDMAEWPALRDSGWLARSLSDPLEIRYWTEAFEQAFHNGKSHIWDVQWTFAVWKGNGLTLVPNVNLVVNIGHGAQSSHTPFPESFVFKLRTYPIVFPLRHPSEVIRHVVADDYWRDRFFLAKKTPWERFRTRVANRHLYGKYLRRIPIVGGLWKQWRARRSQRNSACGTGQR